MDYWQKYAEALRNAKTYAEIGSIALQVQKDMEFKVEQVCGPIGTGGYGTLDQNLESFGRTIDKLKQLGLPMYDQRPMESAIQRIKNGSTIYPKGILTEIYLPLFESGGISKVYFMHNWQTSTGARWENEQCKRLGIDIRYLIKDFHI